MSRSAAKWILKNTIVSRESLTPEISLRLITEASPLWMSTPDKCPLIDPYWAFYWPGGQSLTRYLIDNSNSLENSAVLDFGTGCGSASLVAAKFGAKRLLVNDIDMNALLATKINMRMNQIDDKNGTVQYSSVNLLEGQCVHGDIHRLYKNVPESSRYLLLGDMFYDSDFADTVFSWLKRVKKELSPRILVGDPDRHPLTEKRIVQKYKALFKKTLISSYALPGYVTKEHYGFSTAHVYEIHF